MKIEVTFNYEEVATIKGKKITQATQGLDVYQGNIREIPREKLEKAFTVKDVDYFYYRGKLYTIAKLNDISNRQISTTPIAELRYMLGIGKFSALNKFADTSKLGMLNYIKDYLKSFIVVDGQLFIQRQEPAYHVVQYNQIGVHLQVVNPYKTDLLSDYYNALERQAALDKMVELAEMKKENYIQHKVRAAPTIIVHNPKFVKLKTK